jgi:hypothetical protein
MEPLTFKIITDADDTGVRTYGKSLEGVEFTGHRASHAIKSFVERLGEAQNASDVASAALGSFSRVLGGALAGTAVVVAGKVLIDAFNKVQESVNASTKSFKEAQKQIEKIGLAGINFETASKQAEILSKTAEEIQKNLEKINESRLQSFIAGLTGSKEEMLKLLNTTIEQGKQAQKNAVVQGMLELERQATLSETEKLIESSQKPYIKLIDLARELGDQELINTLYMKAQEAGIRTREQTATKETEKRIEEQKKLEEERQKEVIKLAKAEADFELKQIEAVSKAESDAHKIAMQFADAQMQKDKERIGIIDQQISKIHDRQQSIQTEIDLLLQRNAADAAGYQGSHRGPGAQQSSFEKGLEQQLLRERYKELRKVDQEYHDFIKQNLKDQKKSYDEDAIKREIARKAIKEQADEIGKGTKKLQELRAEQEKLKESEKSLTNEAKNLKDKFQDSVKVVDEWGKKLFDFSKEFTIPAKNMISSALNASGALNQIQGPSEMVRSALGGVSSISQTAINSIGKFSSELNSFKLPGTSGIYGGESDLATETTLNAVLTALTDNLTTLRSYAHAR